MKSEDIFMSDKEHRVVVSIGSKGSYKTTLMLNYIKIKYKNYDEFHLVLPAYKTASNGEQYAFLKQLKNVYIYDKYNELVSQSVSKHVNGKRNIFYGIDDATSSGIDISKDQTLLHLITTTRHSHCQIWLCLHACRRSLCVPIRSNIDYLFLHSISNAKVLEAVYEEFASIKMSKQEFYKLYNERETKIIIFILKPGGNIIDNSVPDWKLFNYKEPIKVETQKPLSNNVIQSKKGFLKGILSFHNKNK